MARLGFALGFVCSAAAMLGGCGAPKPKAEAVPIKKYVLTSIGECVSMTGASEQDCGTAIETAIKAHTTAPTNYPNLRVCEKAEGNDRCERLDDNTWLPIPQGYLVVRVGEQTAAKILYASKDRSAVFRGSDDVMFDPDKPEKVDFSPTSLKRAESFTRLK
jgi:uncharacterized protein YgiB involved in biofilm formation